MATLNVGAMAARLGLDPSEFLDKMKGVQGFNGFVSGEMARQWKKTGRDGQEGMRLIDEALGIHVARPVARIVSETFPALGKAMSGLLPGVAFTALGIAIFEFAEGIGKKMDEAKKKQDEYTDAVLKTKSVMADAAGESQKTFYGLKAKQAGLEGDTAGEAKYKALATNAEAAEKMAKFTDALVAAERRELEASLALMPVWSALGRVWHEIWSSDETLGVEKVGDEIKDFQRKFAELSTEDALKGTTTAAKYLNDQIDESKNKIDDMIRKQAEAQAAAANYVPMGGESELLTEKAAGPSDKEVDAEKARQKQLQAIRHQADLDAREAQAKSDTAKMEAGMRHAEQLRTEIEAVQRLASASLALASSEELAAQATGKGSAASIQATAAAEAQKKIQDFMAEADTKYFSNTRNKIAATKQFQDALAAATPMIRSAAMAEQTSKAVAEYSRNVAEFNTHVKERVAALAAEAEGHGKVASEQAKELATLIPLEEKLQGLKALRDSMRGGAGETAARQPAIGPPTAGQDLDNTIEAMALQYDAAKTRIEKEINPKIQTAAFIEELHKIKDEMNSLAGAEVSPWAKIDAEIKKLTADGKVLPEQVAQIRNALTGLQNVKISSEFEKLTEKLREAHIEAAALASGSPFAKLDAEAAKLGREFGLDAKQITLLRQGLIELQATENAGKAFEGASNLSAGGARMQELRQQMEALQAMQSSGVGTDGSQIDSAALQLEMQAITEEEDKILVKTGAIDAGIKAWADDLQRVKSAAEITLESLGQATKGFEDTATKSLMAPLEAQKTRQSQLINDLRKMWSSYFASLAQMGIKQGLSQLMAPVGKAISGSFGGALGGAKPAGATGAGTLTAAGTSLLHAGTELLSAAMALRASASAASAGGSGGGIGAALDNPELPIPFFAAGGDATPGSSFISGEAGAEQVDLDRAGGAHITPLGFSEKSGGGGGVYNDFSHTVMTDDLMRRAEALAAISHSESRMMQAIPAMQREINQRKRT
jgi:hypothetical protein